MGKTVEEAALGILRVAEHNMSRAIRAVTASAASTRGGSPSSASAAPAACTPAAWPIRSTSPACWSRRTAASSARLGMVAAPAVADASKTVVHLADQLDDARLAAEFGYLNLQVSQQLDNEHTASVEAYADVRFRGQSHEVKVRVTRPTLGDDYRGVSRGVPDAVRAGAGGQGGRDRHAADPARGPPAGHGIAEGGSDRLDGAGIRLIEQNGGLRRGAPMRRSDLVERREAGPFLMIDPEATTLVPTGWNATGNSDGSVMLSRADAVIGMDYGHCTPSPGTPGEGGGEGDFDHQVLG